jgi:hypothetical protein
MREIILSCPHVLQTAHNPAAPRIAGYERFAEHIPLKRRCRIVATEPRITPSVRSGS